MANRFVKIFDIRTQEVQDRNTGKVVKKAKVVFNKDVKITVGGQEIDLGQYKGGFLRKVDEVIQGLENARDAGKLKDDYVDSQVEFLQDKNVSSVFEVDTQPKKNFRAQ